MRGMLLFAIVFCFSIGLKAEELKEWTILVFISGHNDLDNQGYYDIKEMEQVGSTKDINVVVQHGTLQGSQTLRYYIKKSENPYKITSPIVQSFPRVDMGSYKELIKFIEWGVKNYPAKKYFIDIWNHGSGWRWIEGQSLLTQKKLDVLGPQDIGHDELTDNRITTEQLGLVMKHISKYIGRKIDLYGNDACLMAMAEVAAEVSDYVKYFVSSQEDEPGAGWPYHLFLESLSKNPTADGDAAGVMLARAYKKYYDDIGNDVGTTFSVWNLSYFDNFMRNVERLGQNLKGLKSDDLNLISEYVYKTEKYSFSDYKDFYHFIDQISSDKKLALDAKVLNNLEDIRHKLIVYNVNSEAHPNSNGISIWLPSFEFELRGHLDRYREMTFDRKTKWSDFLTHLLSE